MASALGSQGPPSAVHAAPARILAYKPHAKGTRGGPGPPGLNQTKEAQTLFYFNR